MINIISNKEIIPDLDSDLPLLRPLNYPPGTPGHGWVCRGDSMVVNLLGRVFVGTCDCPFRAMDALLERNVDLPKVVIVDMHAEATSEKVALGWYLDGRVSVVAGTHTHVATADTRILPKGTAYVSDLGMVGSTNSVIGVEYENVIQRFLYQTPNRLKVSMEGPIRFNSVLIEIDDSSGKALEIVRVDKQIAADD